MKKWILVATCVLSLSAQAGTQQQTPTQHKQSTPSKAQLEHRQKQYIRYCSACHGKDGTGRDGPALKGSLIATGPMGGNIHMVITGGPHTRMPAWGLTELSDQALADVLTYIRNAWGNDNKTRYGKHAGGVVTPELVKQYREALPEHIHKDNVRL